MCRSKLPQAQKVVNLVLEKRSLCRVSGLLYKLSHGQLETSGEGSFQHKEEGVSDPETHPRKMSGIRRTSDQCFPANPQVE